MVNLIYGFKILQPIFTELICNNSYGYFKLWNKYNNKPFELFYQHFSEFVIFGINYQSIYDGKCFELTEEDLNTYITEGLSSILIHYTSLVKEASENISVKIPETITFSWFICNEDYDHNY